MTLICDACGYAEITGDDYQTLKVGGKVRFVCNECSHKPTLDFKHESALVKEKALRLRRHKPIIIEKETKRLPWIIRLITGCDSVSTTRFEYEQKTNILRTMRSYKMLDKGCEYARYG